MVSSRDKDFGHKNWWKNKHLKDTRDAGISPPTCSLSSALFYHLKWHLLSVCFHRYENLDELVQGQRSNERKE